MQYDDYLEKQVRAAYVPVYATTKAQVIEGYQEKYEDKMGRGGWKQHLVHDLSDMTGQKPKTLEKRFDTQRRGNPEPRNKAQYVELGRKLPPIGRKPPASFTVTFMLDIKISAQCGNIRGPYTVHIGGEDAVEFARNPSFEMVLAYYESEDAGADYDNPFEDVCGIVQLKVS